MKNTTRDFLFSLVGLVIVSAAYGGTVPAMEVIVSNASHKEVYKGRTDASGSFATGELESGNYVVEITSKNPALKGSNFGISVAAGKASVSADAVPGQKIAGNGVALRVAVTGRTKITGRVGDAVVGGKKIASASSGSKFTGPVKIINGKRYFWVRPQTSTLEGGHWVEESEAVETASGTLRPNSPPARPAGGMRY